MSTRREFLIHTAAAGVALSTSVQAAEDAGNSAKALVKARAFSRKPSLRIKSLVRREESTLRLGGHGDNWHMSWAQNDKQFVSLNDGTGFSQPARVFYNSRLFTISGSPQDARFEDISGFPELLTMLGSEQVNRYYGFGTLALDGHIYHYLGTPNHKFDDPNPKFVGSKLIYSPDNGVTWRNQDGSTPVVWEDWGERSQQNMIFFKEQQDAFSLISIAQMGRNYEHNSDGYVYGYSPNGNTEGRMNQIVLFRVPKRRILERAAYQFCTGVQASGNASWSNDIAARVPVVTMPSGWVNTAVHPWAWLPSVTYSASLGIYMMANWATGVSPEGLWFGRPSYLGFWTAPKPWGPWTQVHEETAWTPAGDANARAYSPQIAPKWFAPDGKSFWLAWTDFQMVGSRPDKEILDKLPVAELARIYRQTRPYYAFNVQRVDIVAG